jgi:hypothetical protein
MLFIFSTPELIRNLWKLNTAVFIHWCVIRAAPLAKALVTFLNTKNEVLKKNVTNLNVKAVNWLRKTAFKS